MYIRDIDSKFLILKIDLNGNILNCSKKLLNLVSFSEYDVINKHITSFIDYTSSKYTFEDLLVLLNEVNSSLSVEHKILTLFRQYIYVCADYLHEKDSETGEEFIIINLIEITDIKKEVNSEYSIYEEALYKLELPVAIVDYEGRFEYCNKEMKEVLFELNGFNCTVFGEIISTRIKEVLQGKKLKYEFEYSFDINEELKHVKVFIESLSKGKCRITFLDIQKEKICEDIFEQFKVGIVIEENNGIRYINKKACEIFSIKNKEEAMKKRLIEYIGFEYKLKFLEYFHSKEIEKGYIAKSISNKDIEISTINNNKSKIYFIEECKKGISSTNEEVMVAKEYESLKNEFFANISHELRTPINVIYSVVQLAESIDNNKENILLKYNKILKQNCYRLIRLINNLIEITKIDSGHIEMSLGNYNIINVVEEITLSVADYIESKGLELIFDTEIEELIIACDPDKIECIILNLLANASKFTAPPGKIEVFIEAIEDEFIKISIKDNGQGIPESKQKSIFKRFRQVDKNLYRAHEGSGIGLSLVKSFIELHGGDISLKSAVNEGSEFIIQLPIKVLDKNEHKKIKSYECEKIIDKINIEFSDIYF